MIGPLGKEAEVNRTGKFQNTQGIDRGGVRTGLGGRCPPGQKGCTGERNTSKGPDPTGDGPGIKGKTNQKGVLKGSKGAGSRELAQRENQFVTAGFCESRALENK